MEKYQTYEVEDFVLDKEFVRWVRFPSGEQNDQWDQFLMSYPEKRADIEKARTIIQAMEPLEPPVPVDRLDTIWKSLDESRRKRTLLPVRQLLAYAAVFIFAFLMAAAGFWLLPARKSNYSLVYNEIRVPQGERSEITLYDGTKVWLNSGTELKIPLVFDGNQRKVFLKGEAFFDVAKNKEKPFIVNAGQMDIEVLGTRFDVCAYPDDQELYATLEDGEIRAVNLQTGEEIRMLPGHQAILNMESQRFELQQVNTRLYTSWKENRLQFENAPFFEVIKRMERWYDVKIHVDPTIDTGERYTMTVKTESLREMLRLISITTPVHYEIKENQVFITKE